MENIGRIVPTAALSLLCLATAVGGAHAANCHQQVAGHEYSCSAVTSGGPETFDLVFDPTGDTAIALDTTFTCLCRSTGSSEAGPKNEAGLGIVCVEPGTADTASVISARVAGKELTQGTVTFLGSGGSATFLLACTRIA